MGGFDDPEEMEAEEGAERDPLTDDMFGAPSPAEQELLAEAPPAPRPAGPPPGEAPAYKVLARKYRPRTFADLIGQEAMVRTLTNAFSSGRIAHAFMLTGVRGVGKTTTARLLARALNYDAPGADRPTLDLAADGRHCEAIVEGRHMDVLELDAASRTKVDEMRELLDGVRYAPVEARYKVYIIDEVHMLSTAAFNALLKTLEEPPPHAKFIFATTEIRKVPVTILSRCQRFDLRRVEPEVLAAHLKRVADAEGATVEQDALALLARAAEGSVRDALSLLDQAIVQAEPGQPVGAAVVRDMLGLADRGATIDLFEAAMGGRTADALSQFHTLYGFGAEPSLVIGDLLEHAHGAAVAKSLGPKALTLPREQAERLEGMGRAVSVGVLSRVWQLLLKAHEEVRRSPDPKAAAEMALIRLCYAADLPGPEEALRQLAAGETPVGPAGGPGGGGGVRASAGGGGAAAAFGRPLETAQPAPAAAPTATLASFEDLLRLIGEKRDIQLKFDVERYVRPIRFAPPAFTYEPAPGAPSNLQQRLVARLKAWTGQPWFVTIETGGGAESALEAKRRAVREREAEAAQHPFVRDVLSVFPDAEVVVSPVPAPQMSAPAEESGDPGPDSADAYGAAADDEF